MAKVLPGDGDVCLLDGDLGGAVGGVERRVHALSELGGADEKEVALLVAGDEDVVLVLALLSFSFIQIL